MIQSNDILHWLALNDKRGLIPHYLLEYIINKFGSMKEFWNSSKKEIMDIRLKTDDVNKFINYANRVQLDSYKDTLNYVKKNNIKIIRYTDDEYPEILKLSSTAIHEPPILLFRKGKKIDFLKSVAIVGTRRSSKYAQIKARQFSRELAEKKFWIISGMAKGIDSEAHSGALDTRGGKTIAVLPWMTPITPMSIIELSEKIMQNGCLISEKIKRPPARAKELLKYPFIERNRITSGLSNFLIAVESGPSGGTIRQVDLALSQKKAIYTLYPSPNSEPEMIEGFNFLIEKKGAKPIENISDIIYIKQYEHIQNKSKRGSKVDVNSWKLIYGYNEEDAINRYITTTNKQITKENVNILQLENHSLTKNKLALKYYILYSPELKDERPICPRCGSKHIISRGHSWHCENCDKYFTKKSYAIV